MTRRSRSIAKLADELASLSPEGADLPIATDSRFQSRQVARRLTELSVAALHHLLQRTFRAHRLPIALLPFA